MLIYLDVCSLQRPYDDRSQQRIDEEAEAVLIVVDECLRGNIDILSSEAIQFELSRNPHEEPRQKVEETLELASSVIGLNDEIEARASELVAIGLKPLDALHLASAESVQADYFCTCDDRLLKRGRTVSIPPTKVVSPQELVAEIVK